MIEPELAFADLNDDMACATAYLQYVVCYFSKLFSWTLLSNHFLENSPTNLLELSSDIVIFGF